jgi:hypothetical protein
MATTRYLVSALLISLVTASGCARRTIGIDVRDQLTGAPLEGALVKIRQAYVLNPFPPGPIRVRTNSQGIAWARVEKTRPIMAQVIEMSGYDLSSEFNRDSDEHYWVPDPKKGDSIKSSEPDGHVMVYVIRLYPNERTSPAREEGQLPITPASSPR